MRIEFSRNVIIRSDNGCFILDYYGEELVYKSFDLLLFSLLNKTLVNSESESVEQIIMEIREFKDFVYGIFAMSDYGEYIQRMNREHTGVDYGKQNTGNCVQNS